MEWKWDMGISGLKRDVNVGQNGENLVVLIFVQGQGLFFLFFSFPISFFFLSFFLFCLCFILFIFSFIWICVYISFHFFCSYFLYLISFLYPFSFSLIYQLPLQSFLCAPLSSSREKKLTLYGDPGDIHGRRRNIQRRQGN